MSTSASPTAVAAAPESGRIAKTAGYYIAYVVLGLTSTIIGPTLPGLAAHTHAAIGAASVLFAAHWTGYLFGTILGGRIYDRVPGHPVIVGVLLAMTAMMATVPFVSILWLLAAVLLVLGVGEGILDVGGNTLLVWVHREKVAPFMNGLHFFVGVGSFLSPFVVARTMLATGDALHAYWVLAVLMLPACFWLGRLPSPRASAVDGDRGDGRPDPILVLLIAAFFFTFAGAEVAFGGWIYTYAREQGLETATSAAYLNSAYWGAFALGRLLGIALAARLAPRTMLAADLVGCLASLGLMLASPVSQAAVRVGALGFGFFIASMFATALVFAGRRMRITGKVTGYFLIGASFGTICLPWLIGQLFEPVGPEAALIVIAADMLVSLAVFAALGVYRPRPAPTEA